MATPVQNAVLQAWISLRADDPEAVSAFAVARASDARLGGLTRMRLMEISGSRADPAAARVLLHSSTQFYNPHKEHCAIGARAPEPVRGAAIARVAVWEREGARRAAAERWWRHETQETVEVREAAVWELSCEAGHDVMAIAEELALLRDGRHGLLCNPWSQEFRLLVAGDPPPWIGSPTGSIRTGGNR